MKELLTKFISVCLKDDVISDKEREIIMKKARGLGIEQKECEIILEDMIRKRKKSDTITNNATDPKATTIKKVFYKNGNIKSEGEYTLGSLNGIGKEYYENGKIWKEGEFKDGKLNGIGKEYSVLFRPLWKEGEFKDEKLNGIGRIYHDASDFCWLVGEFKDEKLNGIGKVFYDNGNIKSVGEYTLGILNGIGKKYYENGKPWEEGEFKDGKLNGYGKTYNENRKLKEVGELKDGKLNGIGKEFYDNGNIKSVGEYTLGVLNGVGKKYYENGNIWEEGEFMDGKLILKTPLEQEKKEVAQITIPIKENNIAASKDDAKQKDYSVFEKKGVPWYLIEDLKAGKINHIWYAKTIYYFTHDYYNDEIEIFIPSEGKMTRGSAKIWIKENTYRNELQSFKMRNGKKLTKIEFIEFYEIK